MTSYIVRLNYYKEGVKRKAYHLFGDKEQNRASIKKIYDILTGMAFGKIPDAITRHKGSGTLEDPFQMEPLILQYIPIPPDNHDGEVEDLIEWDEPDGPDPDPDDFDEPLELEDPEGPDEDPEEPQKPNPPIVILVDCTKENEDLAESANDILTNFKANGLNDFIANYKDADVEYAQSLYYGSDEDGSKKWLQGEIVTNNQPYSVNIEYGDDYVTSIHNHPTGNPHSVKDILGLAEMNAKYSDAKTSYVISSDGSLFVLYLEDSAKAQAFYEKYNGNTSEVDQGYSMAITYITPHSDEKTAKLHALAYVLEKYNTGMKILRREVNEKGNEGFRVRQTSLTLDERGMSTVVLTRCK